MAVGVSFNRILDIHPEVVNSSSSHFRMSGLVLTESAVMGDDIQSFSNAAAVGKFFGTGSLEYSFAAAYFSGWIGKSNTISNITFANYQASGSPAFLRSSVFSTNDYASIKSVSGDLSLTINGKLETVHMDFSAANSMSDIAADIQTAFPDVTCEYNALIGILIIKTKQVGADQTLSVADGDVANALRISVSGGGIATSGSVAMSAADRIAKVTNTFRGFASFTHIFPLSNVDMLNLSKFASQYGTGASVVYIAPVSDNSALIPNNSATFSALVKQAGFGCTQSVWTGGDYTIAALAMSYAPGLDFTKDNAAVPFAGISSNSVAANVIDNDTYDALKSNGYNCYAQFATANDNAPLFYDGSVSGDFENVDNLYEIIYMQDACQLAFMTFIKNHTLGIPVNGRGDAIIRSILTPTFEQMVDFGAILTGISPDTDEMEQISPQVGNVDITQSLNANGYYIYVAPLSAANRSNRKASIVVVYMKANKIQTFSLTLIAVS